MIKFSFIIPVYNCASYLINCVDCIRAIGLEQYEIILVNDGSQDGSALVCEKLSQQFEVIKYIFQSNQGVSSARNNGLSVATGEYVVFIDADDTIDSAKMRNLLYKIEENNSIDIALFGMSFDYYYHGKCYRNDLMGYPNEGLMTKNDLLSCFEELYLHNFISPVWNKVIRRKILTDNWIEFKKEMFIYEDLEFSIRCMTHCNSIYISPEIIYQYRQTEDEGNAGRRLAIIGDLCTVIKPIENALVLLYAKDGTNKSNEIINSILLKLYSVLLREKVNISSKNEIRNVGVQFDEWLNEKQIAHGDILSEQEWVYIDKVLNQKICSLMIDRKFIAIKHRLAVAVKSTQLYQNMHR